jgi:colanic acid/amylovoran biosynthesis glycosyltransferase
MRIAFVVWRFPMLSETFILNQITGLIDRGHTVDIYADEPGETERMHPAVEQYGLLKQTHYVGVMPEKQLPRVIKGLRLSTHFHKNPLVLLRSLNPFKYGKQAASLRLLYAATPFLGKQSYDIIHCQFGELGLRCAQFRSLGASQAKLVTSFRGYDISRFVQKYGDEVYRPLFERGDVFLPNCDYFGKRLVKLGCPAEQVVVMRSGIDCTQFTFTPRKQPTDGVIRIVTTGRLAEKKGVEYGIRAIAKLITTHPNIEYNIVGDGAFRQLLQRLIEQLGVANQVNLLGSQPQQELIQTLSRSHIFLAPNVTGKDGDQDAPVNVLKEAMAMGLPVVSTWHGGIPEIVQDRISGFLVPERDVDALVEKLKYLIDHAEIWSDLGQAGRSYVTAHYEINQLNDRLVEIYQQLQSNSAGLKV